MKLKIVDNEESGLSEEGLISILMGNGFTPKQKPRPSMVLAQQATDFWVEQWRLQGVEILSAELKTEFDPEDDLWYFVIELICSEKDNADSEVFGNKHFEIINVLSEDYESNLWALEYLVITTRD